MKKSANLILALTLSLCIIQNALGQQTAYVGIRSDNFNYFASSQRNSNWCWAASLQMIFNYYGIRITQEQIVARSYGVDPYGQLPNWTGSLQVITANLNNWSVDNSGRNYAVGATLNLGAPTPLYLVQELSAQRPVLIGYQSGPNSGHAVVVTACSYTPSAYGPIIESIVVRDPWPSEQNIYNNGRVEYLGQNIAVLMQAHWYIRIQ
ncbi:C39 family peptidase [Algoriphagus terrigena]|uniref:C39 family peptidase n=1 Tax=Algoriphagus terrigena TaxID=344884 RepID=UPI000A068EA8|nr:papain-like cysteine protease family protein [Algoriphagus terrigena]